MRLRVGVCETEAAWLCVWLGVGVLVGVLVEEGEGVELKLREAVPISKKQCTIQNTLRI